MIRRQRPHVCQPARDRIGDVAGVPARPDPGTIDAAAAAVQEHAVDHHVEKLFPAIHLIVADEDLRESGTVRLHRRITAIAIHRRRAAENQVAPAVFEDGGADIALAGIDRDGLARNAGGEEGFRHAIGRPWLLRSRFEHEANLQRNHRQPQSVHTGRIRRQDEADHGTLDLIADRHAALLAVSARQHLEVEATRQRIENTAHLGEHERVLFHVRPAHALGKPRRRRLRPDEFVRRLRAVTNRQGRVHVQLASLARPADQFVDRDVTQHLACARRLAHVALNQPAVRTAHVRNRLAGREVHNRIDDHARVRLAPAEDGKVKHNQT